MLNIKKIYGPYINRKQKRSFVVVVFNDGSKKTMSNARLILSKKCGRWLEEKETVDHIDDNPLNDSDENLQILSLADNIRKSMIPAKIYKFNCPICGEYTEKPLSKVLHNRKQQKAGPFCGKKCSRQWQIIQKNL